MSERDPDDVRPFGGLVQMQLAGDPDLAMSHSLEGRRLLGRMLNAYGVEERIRNGEEGGFHQQVRMLEDGTRLTAITNHGTHTVRIETPLGPTASQGSPHSAHADTPSTHDWRHLDAEGGFVDQPPPLPPVKLREVEDEDEERKKERSDYMWVGIRTTNPDVYWYAINTAMVEPDSGADWDDDHNPLRGVVLSNALWYGKRFHLVESTDPEKAGQYETTIAADFIETDNMHEAVQANYDLYSTIDGATEQMIPGTHHVRVLLGEDYNDGEFQASANGLCCFSTWSTQPGQTDISKWLPYDPEAHDQTGADPRDYPNQQVRNYGDRHISPSYPIAPRLWDICYVCDPDEALGEYPVETRPHVLAARVALEKAGMRNVMLPGEYMLGINCYGDPPQLRSSRANEVIPMYAGETFGYRSATSDYDEFMVPNSTTHDTSVEIEVRLGRGQAATIQRFHTSVRSADYRDYAVLPYGFGTWDECLQEGGPNPLGPNWAQQWLAIDAMGGSAKWVDDPGIAPIFGGGQYGAPDDHRRPLDIYLMIYGPSQPTQEEYAEYMANALFAVMEAASAGVYGEVLMKDPGGESGLRSLLANVSKSQIWRFDPMAMSLTAVPLISAVDDYPYGTQTDSFGNEFQSPYIEPMFWYYPYKILSRDQCRNSLGICITAVKGTYFFESGQAVYFADPPLTVDCC